MYTIRHQQVFLSSRYATVQTNGNRMLSDVMFNFGALTSTRLQPVQRRISLLYAEIPNSFYNINEYNNKINVSGVTYTFPPGVYNVTSFITQWAAVVGAGWTITLSSLTNCLTFVSPGGAAFYLSDPSSSLFPVVGLPSGVWSAPSGTLVAPYCCNFWALRRILIGCPTFSMDNVNSQDSARSRIIGCVPVTTQPGGIILYSSTSQVWTTVNHRRDVTSLEIQLLDEAMRPLDCNGVDWTLTLAIEELVPLAPPEEDLLSLYERLDDSAQAETE